ncbi:MAG: hypothetical protein GEU75_07090 [Dehalococcoidia bacterium]|nr:hypothetical protein [Dehalococcoidia bacterium]
MEDKELLATFEGPRGKAEVFEVTKPGDRPLVEQIVYEIEFKGETHTRMTMGEASVVASGLTGDPRYQGYVETGRR